MQTNLTTAYHKIKNGNRKRVKETTTLTKSTKPQKATNKSLTLRENRAPGSQERSTIFLFEKEAGKGKKCQ